jgi:hypothetical protein
MQVCGFHTITNCYTTELICHPLWTHSHPSMYVSSVCSAIYRCSAQFLSLCLLTNCITHTHTPPANTRHMNTPASPPPPQQCNNQQNVWKFNCTFCCLFQSSVCGSAYPKYEFGFTCKTTHQNTKFKKRWPQEINTANDETVSAIQNTLHLKFGITHSQNYNYEITFLQVEKCWVHEQWSNGWVAVLTDRDCSLLVGGAELGNETSVRSLQSFKTLQLVSGHYSPSKHCN